MRPALRSVAVRVPATSANLGPGFDCVGAALQLYNRIEVRVNERGQKNKLQINIKGQGVDCLPRGRDNLVFRTLNTYFLRHGLSWNTLALTLVNDIPLARGLGSSAAARVGALYAAHAICGVKDRRDDILDIAVNDEGHADNIVPALIGGLCIARVDDDGITWWKEKIAHDLRAVLCVPDFAIHTPAARKLLPRTYLRTTAVYTISGTGLFVSAATARASHKRDQVIRRSMRDKFHQPYRKHLISGMADVFNAAEKAGALGAALSGSGPTIIAIARRSSSLKRIGEAMVRAFSLEQVTSTCTAVNFDTEGARRI